jgi:hypothetical protein
MTLSFLHGGAEKDASYRYRARRPAEALGASINNFGAEILVFAKPHPENLPHLRLATRLGRCTILDTCDVHWQHPEVKTMMQEAAYLTVNTPYLQDLVQHTFGRSAAVIDDPYEYEEVPPHCQGNNLLWFGHPSNGASFNRFAAFMEGFPHEVVTHRKHDDDPPWMLDWSHEVLRRSFAKADIVLIPETAPYKSCNRTVEAVRQGCFVVAEPHPSLKEFPGIWVGNIKQGVAWTIAHQEEARARTREAQAFVRERYSLARTVNAWKTLLTAVRSTWGPGASIGMDGSTSMPSVGAALPM